MKNTNKAKHKLKKKEKKKKKRGRKVAWEQKARVKDKMESWKKTDSWPHS